MRFITFYHSSHKPGKGAINSSQYKWEGLTVSLYLSIQRREDLLVPLALSIQYIERVSPKTIMRFTNPFSFLSTKPQIEEEVIYAFLSCTFLPFQRRNLTPHFMELSTLR